MEQRTLVLIKPDAMVKRLAGNIIQEIDSLGLKMIGLKLVNVEQEFAEQHYGEHKDKPFFKELIDYITGKLHHENVIAIVYQGENSIQKIRNLAGETNPDKAQPFSLRGKYGKVHSINSCHETVLHASDSEESAKREVQLWFDKNELIE